MAPPSPTPKKVFTMENVPHLITGTQSYRQLNSTNPSTPLIVNAPQQNSVVLPTPPTQPPEQAGTNTGNYAESVVSTSTNPSDCTSSTCSVTSSLIEREQQALNRLARQRDQVQNDLRVARIIAECCQEEGHKTCSHKGPEHVVPQHR